MNEYRLGVQAGEVIDRTRPVKFRWNGKRVEGFQGDTIVSAMLANGHRIFSRSMKYHRPRGVLTADYWDPNTNVQVGTEPNVRAGHRLVESGLDVRPQNVWPSLDVDVKALNGLAGRFLTPGFYYKTFMRPQPLWPLYERVLARYAPGGHVDLDTPHGDYDTRFAHPDVLVAGGGPAGLSAAIGAAEAGAEVMLVEHDHDLGGHLRLGVGVRSGRRGGAHRRRDAGRRRDSHRLHRDRPLHRQLGGRRAAIPSRRGGAAREGAGQDARGRAGPDRATLCVCGQRPSRGDALGGGAPAGEHVCGRTRQQGGGAHGQPRRRRRGRRSGAGGRGGRGRDRRSGGRNAEPGDRVVEAAQRGDPGRRIEGRGRPAGHRGGLDRPDLAAQHGRRPSHLRRPALPGSSPPRHPTRCSRRAGWPATEPPKS